MSYQSKNAIILLLYSENTFNPFKAQIPFHILAQNCSFINTPTMSFRSFIHTPLILLVSLLTTFKKHPKYKESSFFLMYNLITTKKPY